MNTILKHSIPLLIGLAGSSAWAACVTQPSPDNSIVANAAGDTCTNNVNINTSATDLAGFGMSDTPLGVAVNSATLINSSSGTITTTGAGATGIHSEGENAIIINNGSINTSGGQILVGSTVYYADGINALGNNSQVTNTGSITVSGLGMWGVWYGPGSSGSSLNNSGTILATGSNSYGVYSGGSLQSFLNSGSISATGLGSIGVGVANVTTFTNTGTITGTDFDLLVAFGTIGTLNNAQGGNATSLSTTALTFTGTLPTNYNIIINSSTHYGQLAASSPSGAITNFGIYGTPFITSRTYASVLSGTGGLPTGTRSGTYDNMTWSLVENGSAIDLVFTGASLMGTQQSLVNTASVLQGTFTLQNSVMVNGFTYDCSLFDQHGICVSAGGRNTTVQAQGINNTSGLLIASYRLNQNNSRIGAWVDQNLSMSGPGTVQLGNSTPMIGLFGVWSQRPDAVGAEVKISAAYGQKDTTITRQVVGTSEAGSGGSQLISQGAQVMAKYGFAVLPDVVVSPYAGVRYTQNNMGGYTEATSSAVTAPLTYSALNTNATTALAGAEARYRGIPKTTLFASAGVETDTNTSNGSYSASGINGLTPVNFNPNPVKTRPTATVGGYYDILKNQRIGVTGIYRQEPFQAVSTTTVLATYTIGL
jgi:Autotransporter beta-domain